MQGIRQTGVDSKIKGDDPQFLIGGEGRVVIADPLRVQVGVAPSKNNLRMIALLINKDRRVIDKMNIPQNFSQSDIPSHYSEVLHTLIGRRIIGATRYSWWPAEETEHKEDARIRNITAQAYLEKGDSASFNQLVIE